MLLMTANRRLKARVAELENKTSLNGTLTTIDIPQFDSELSATAAGLSQGDVYYDTSLERMRSVN